MPKVPLLGVRVRELLAENRVLRISELLDETPHGELAVRHELDQLQVDGEVTTFPVGEHIMVKATDEFSPPSARVPVDPEAPPPTLGVDRTDG